VFLVISVYFNLGNILPKSGTFPPGTPFIQSGSVCVVTMSQIGQPWSLGSIPASDPDFSLNTQCAHILGFAQTPVQFAPGAFMMG